MLGKAQTDEDLAEAFRARWVEVRRSYARAVFRHAQRTGQIRADLDIETAIDMVYGPVYYRLMTGHAPLTDEFADCVVEYALRGLAPR